MLKQMVAALALASMLPVTAQAAPASASMACDAIAHHVDATGGADRNSPLFLRSYEQGPDEAALPDALATSAFSYDNALAIMALVACGDVPRARRIGNAFMTASRSDRTFTDGRIRNAYRAGVVVPGPVPMPGWWDKQQNLWAEDPFQDATQTGNVAWVALALLTLDQAAPSAGYRAGAEGLARWIADYTRDPRPPGGFSGGTIGYDPAQTRVGWRSTEHNVDVNALGFWLARLGNNDLGQTLSRPSRVFLDAMFDADRGLFRLGTVEQGATQPPEKVALDELIWPLIGVADAPKAWRRSLDFAKANLAVPGGFDFNNDRDGLWTEGTAQAALVERAVGDGAAADALLKTATSLAAPSGYLYATKAGQITTGLPLGPDSKSDDFYYFHRPHLGATAWAALAEARWNPFTGQTVP